MLQEEYDSQPGSPGPSKRRRYVRVSRACNECRVRKIRCNGRQPCEPCEDFERHCTFTSTRGQKMAGAPRTKILEDRLRRARSLIAKFQAQNPSAELEAEVQSIFESPPGSPSTDSDLNDVADDSFGGIRIDQSARERHAARQTVAQSPHSRSSASEPSHTPGIMTNNPGQLSYRPQPHSAPTAPMIHDAMGLSMYSPPEMHYPDHIPTWDPSAEASAMGYDPYFTSPPVSYGGGRSQHYQQANGRIATHVPPADGPSWSYPLPLETGQGRVRPQPPTSFPQVQNSTVAYTHLPRGHRPYR